MKTHTEIWTERNEAKTVILKPMPMTRKINVKVPFTPGEGVTVERMVGTISGVPGQIQLMTGYVSDRNTGKVPFEMTPDGGQDFKGEINVFGLFPAPDTIEVVGPGVLTLTIHVSVEENGETHNRMFYANVNMKKTIEDAEIMILSPDRATYRFSDTENVDNEGNLLKIKEFTISVDDAQIGTITKDMIITDSNDGFAVWKPVEDNDDKDKNPGLFPDV